MSLPQEPKAFIEAVINPKWVEAMMQEEMASTQRYKARLVARGNKQQHGIDYEETSTPLVTSWRSHRNVESSSACFVDPSKPVASCAFFGLLEILLCLLSSPSFYIILRMAA